jgi:hypothetical protein
MAQLVSQFKGRLPEAVFEKLNRSLSTDMLLSAGYAGLVLSRR